MIAPRVVPIVSVTGALGLILSGFLAYVVVDRTHDEDQRDCERTVAYRDDSRAMWLYLVDTAEAKPAQVDAFVTELNSRLPRLECRDGNAVPAKP